MKPDITNQKDILTIITNFYTLLLADKQMFPFFKDIVQANQLQPHLEIISDFWNDILFDTTSYQNNTMKKHLDKNTFIAFTKEHFSIWTSYLYQTINKDFNGVIAELMKNRALSIATVMQLKMNLYKD